MRSSKQGEETKVICFRGGYNLRKGNKLPRKGRINQYMEGEDKSIQDDVEVEND